MYLSFDNRNKKLDESLSYHEFCALVSEEEAWLSEKISVQQSEDFGDSLAAVQVSFIINFNDCKDYFK